VLDGVVVDVEAQARFVQALDPLASSAGFFGGLRVIARPCCDVARRLPLVVHDRKGATAAASAQLE
jgi:hypothetical protein